MNKEIKSHKDLEIWKRSIELVVQTYKNTEKFPDNEKFGLTNQMRRAAVSVPSNIAEGAGRKSSKEFVQFLSVSLGSLAELETQYIIANKLDYFHELEPIVEEIKMIGIMIRGLIKRIS